MLYIAHLTEANKFHVTFHDFRLQIIIIICYRVHAIC